MKQREYAVNEMNLPKDYSWANHEVVLACQKNDVYIQASNTDVLCDLMFFWDDTKTKLPTW